MNGTKKGDIIVRKKGGEEEMAELLCPNCEQIFGVNCGGETKMWGIIQCTKCEHEIPFTMYHNYIQKVDIALPGAQSECLNTSVPEDLKDDIKEAERANYYQCYKACVIMCRRGLQLGLIDKGIEDGNLSGMLGKAHIRKFIDEDIYNLSTTIKGFGDIGAHKREVLEPLEVNMVIHATVKMLNELFTPPS